MSLFRLAYTFLISQTWPFDRKGNLMGKRVAQAALAAVRAAVAVPLCLAIVPATAFATDGEAGFAKSASFASGSGATLARVIDVELLASATPIARGTAWDFWEYVGDDAAVAYLNGIAQGLFGPTAQGAHTTDDLSEPVNALSLENAGEGLAIIAACNDIRVEEGLSELAVSPRLMAISAAAANYAVDYSNVSNPHRVAQETNVGENLAWNFGSGADGVATAFVQWYTEERELWFSDLYVEARAYYEAGASLYDVSIAYPQAAAACGHYLNIIEPAYTVSGAAFSAREDSEVWNVFEQSFNYGASGEKTYRVEELQTLYNQYLDTIEPPDASSLGALRSEIAESSAVADASVASGDGLDVYANEYWASDENVKVFRQAVRDAEAVLADSDATSSDVVTATERLAEAREIFLREAKNGYLFTDVDYAGSTSDAWMAPWVTEAAQLGLMAGYRDATSQQLTGAFGPRGLLTRGQAIVVLYRAMTGASADEPAGENTTPSVEPDVVVPTYYTNALNWAYAEGVMVGDIDQVTGERYNTLRPNDPISRQELALLVWRCAGSPQAADRTTYESASDAGDEWASASDAFAWTAEQGILSGSTEATGTYLHPANPALRGQAAKIFVAALGFLA